MKNKNILILGSTGFIGRSLTKKLLSKDYYITSPVRNPDKVKRNILSGDIGQINIVPLVYQIFTQLNQILKRPISL